MSICAVRTATEPAVDDGCSLPTRHTAGSAPCTNPRADTPTASTLHKAEIDALVLAAARNGLTTHPAAAYEIGHALQDAHRQTLRIPPHSDSPAAVDYQPPSAATPAHYDPIALLKVLDRCEDTLTACPDWEITSACAWLEHVRAALTSQLPDELQRWHTDPITGLQCPGYRITDAYSRAPRRIVHLQQLPRQERP